MRGSLTQSSSLTLRLHQAQDVVLSDWTLDVSDNGSGGVLQELNSDLGDTTSRAGSAQNLDNLSKSNWSLSVLDVSRCSSFDSISLSDP